MPNPKHPETLKRGVEGWNRWREEHKEEIPNLRGADLRRANLVMLRRVRAQIGPDASSLVLSMVGSDLYLIPRQRWARAKAVPANSS